MDNVAAYVLIITESSPTIVLKDIQKIANVSEALALDGNYYDIIVKAEADNLDKVEETAKYIRKRDYVRSTLTMKLNEGFFKDFIIDEFKNYPLIF